MCELACTRWQGNDNIVQREGYFFLRYTLRLAPIHERSMILSDVNLILNVIVSLGT